MNIIYFIFFAVLVLAFIYLMFMCLKALRTPVKEYPNANVNHYFAILIPARNEEMVIGNLIDSLQAQAYPKDCFDVYTIVNNCTDKTEECAKEHGSKIIACGKVTSKGQALAEAFKVLDKKEDIEAYVVFDADNVVDKNFLTAMNNAFDCGAELIQGRRTGKNRLDNMISGCYEIFYTMQNIFCNHVNTATGKSAAFNGTGWLISKHLADSGIFTAATITEDLEFTAITALHNIHIDYAHQAITYDEYPTHFRIQMRQLERWIYGQLECLFAYGKDLLKKGIKDRSMDSLNMAVIFFTPITAVLMVLFLIRTPFIDTDNYFIHWFQTHITLVLLMLYGILIVFLAAGAHKCGIRAKGVFAFPCFICMWLPVMIYCLFKDDCEWMPITHSRQIRIEDITNEQC